MFGELSGDDSGLFGIGLPFGGVVRGISTSWEGQRRFRSKLGRVPYLSISTVL